MVPFTTVSLHHTCTTRFHCWCDVSSLKCCVTFTPNATGCTLFNKFNLCLVIPQSIFTKVLEIIKFSGKSETSLHVLFAQQCFSVLELCHAGHSYGGIMNTDLNWGKWGLQSCGCCCGVFCGSLLWSWSATPGKVHYGSIFWPFVDNGSCCGSLESQTFTNGFISSSRLIDFNYFVSHFFGSQHDVWLLRLVWSTSLLPCSLTADVNSISPLLSFCRCEWSLWFTGP